MIFIIRSILENMETTGIRFYTIILRYTVFIDIQTYSIYRYIQNKSTIENRISYVYNS